MKAQYLPRLPAHWRMQPAKALFTERRESATEYDQHLTPSQAYGVVTQADYMRLTGSRVVQVIEGSITMKHVEPDDFVIHLRSFQGGIERSRIAGKVSPAYTVLTPRPTAVPGFFRWVLKSDGYIQELRTTTNQLRDGQSIKFSNFSEVPLPCPPINEQQVIADYLDRETAQIDTLIAKQEQLIATLRERRIGVITHSVAPHTGTGDKWFGAIPDTWATTPLGYNFTVLLGKMINGNSTEKNSSVAPYLAAGSIQPDELILDPDKRMPFTPAELKRFDLRAGDIVVVEGGAGYGRSHYLRAALDGWGYQNHVARLRETAGVVDALYVTYCLKACLASGYVEANNRTATLPSLSGEVLSKIPIVYPSRDRQRQIAAHLDHELAAIDAITTRAEQLISLARERRAALITAAVTGQIDVRATA